MPDRPLLGALLVAIGLACSACGRSPQLDFSKQGTLREPRWCGLGNFAVVHIDPNGRAVDYHWTAFDKRHGNAFNVPFEQVTLEVKWQDVWSSAASHDDG